MCNTQTKTDTNKTENRYQHNHRIIKTKFKDKRKRLALPSQTKLKELFDYDPATGILTYKKKARRYFNSDKAWKQFNTRCAGQPVGSVGKANGDKYTAYLSVGLDGKSYRVHRLIWKWMTGEDPDCIDHIDGDGLNNKWNNLRNVTQQENMQNLRKKNN